MTDRRRNGLILLLVLGLLLASAVVMTQRPTRLGLDLKGGVELVYQGEPTQQVPKITPEALDRAVDIIRERVDQLGVGEPEIQRAGSNQISVGLPSVQNIARAKQQVGTPAQLYFYDWEANVLTPQGKRVAPLLSAGDPTAQAISQQGGNPGQGLPAYDAVRLASKQPASTGNSGGSRIGPAYYLFDSQHRYLAGPERLRRDLLSAIDKRTLPPKSIVLSVPQGFVVLQAAPQDANSQVPIKDPSARFYVLRDHVALSGKDIRDPQQGFNQGQQPDVEFQFTGAGKTAFHNVTRTIAQRGTLLKLPGVTVEQAQQHFAVALDGKLISVASIDPQQLPDGIDGENGAIIEGGFTIQSAQDLANLLKLGALPIGLKLISESQVSATLGKQALHQGLIAGIVGLAIVALFLITFYRMLGVIATGALFIYAVYLYGLIKLVPITLTLPGIAGLILGIGVAADANIVIFERVKEELRAGRSVTQAIATGYRKGLTAIVDANVVTVMTAFILFMLATSGVKGFAFTLGVGTLVSLFTAVMATQAILATLGRTPVLMSKGALGAHVAGARWRFDFMGASRWFFSMSGMILLIGALSIGGKGLNFGIDFTSGTRVTTNLVQPASESQLRTVLDSVGASDAKIQRVSNKQLGPNVVQISTDQVNVAKLRTKLGQQFGGTTNFSSESVGPTFGQTVANSAIVAIIASLIVISAYIALRFQWKFAVPVLIALMHDLLITSGIYSLTGREVTSATVAALLTILGYSLYDTIIVFDRIRENMPRMPRAAFSQIANRSMSEVLTRSLATTLSTALPILALLLFGGQTLRDFAFALLVGVVSGAYSSIFIATPVLQHWKEREPVYMQRRKRIEAENLGVVPAYAVATFGGEPVDVEPEAPKRRSVRVLSNENPEDVTEEEFEALKADLGVDDEGAVARPRPARRGRAATATPPQTPPAAPKPRLDEDGRAPDEAENDGMMREEPRKPRSSGRRNRRHGRSR
ncbi:MAG TPA: protein translocase subunit SecD [Conexibacter sp.]|nr:protein translocase subunit SecD [Conexibacter sp.]